MTKISAIGELFQCPNCEHSFESMEFLQGFTKCGNCGTGLQLIARLKVIGRVRRSPGQGIRPVHERMLPEPEVEEPEQRGF